MSGSPFLPGGNINEERDVPWPDYARGAFLAPVPESMPWCAWPPPVSPHRLVSEECQARIDRAMAQYAWEQSLQQAGWRSGVPDVGTPCYVLLRDEWGAVEGHPFYAVYRGRGMWDDDVPEDHVAYWWALPFPPGEVERP